ERADEAPLLVVLVYGLLGRLPAVQPPGRDAEPLGRLYACSEDRIREAASEKGTSTSRRFSDHAAFARSSNCLLVSRSLSSRSQSSSSSSGSTVARRMLVQKRRPLRARHRPQAERDRAIAHLPTQRLDALSDLPQPSAAGERVAALTLGLGQFTLGLLDLGDKRRVEAHLHCALRQ